MARSITFNGITQFMPGGGGNMATHMMSEEFLTDQLRHFGAVRVNSKRESHNKTLERYSGPARGMSDMRKGISLHGVWSSSWTISLQAGASNYSEPRAFADEYSSIEIAVWNKNDGDNLISLSKLWEQYIREISPEHEVPYSEIKEAAETRNDSVSGWVDWPVVQAVIKILASMRSAPTGNMEREQAPWRIE